MSQRSAIGAADITHVMCHTEDLWKELRGARLFITGGTGFVGKWLLETLLVANARHKLGATAVVLSRDLVRFQKQAPWIAQADGIDLLAGDIRDFAFPAGKFSHLIHAAAEMATNSAPLQVHDVIVNGTRRVLELAAERAIDDVLVVSSGAVYGRQPRELVRMAEDFLGAPTLYDPSTAYAQGKRSAEWLTHSVAAATGLRCRIARLFALIGPYLPLDGPYAGGNFIADLQAGRPIHVANDGTPLRSYLYAADMAIWLWTLLLTGKPGLTCNVGGDEIVSIAELAALIAGLATPPLPVRIAQPAIPGAAPPRYVPSIDLARVELGLVPRISLKDGLCRMVKSHQSAAMERPPFA